MKIDEIKNLEAQLEAAIEDQYVRGEDYGDALALARSEIARYGDAWVGAYDQLARLRNAANKAKEKVEAIKAKLPPIQGCSPRPYLWYDGEEVPF
jgi:hypothetical protein